MTERDPVAEVRAPVRDGLHLRVRIGDVDGLDAVQVRNALPPVARIPDDLPLERLDPDSLPGWEAEDSPAARARGDEWHSSGRTAVLVQLGP